MNDGFNSYRGPKRFGVTVMAMYVKFMTNNAGKSRKELIKAIEDIEDIPGFIKNVKHEAEDLDILTFLACFLGLFLKQHECKNCRKYSLDKCSACNWAHYCSVECQEEDFEKHSKVCL